MTQAQFRPSLAAAALIAALITPINASAQFGGMGGLGGLVGGKSSSEKAPVGGDVVAQQDQLVKEYVTADRGVLLGQSKMAEALGLKQRAATLAATADALTSGSTQDNLSEADKVVSESNAELAARMKENPELDAASKKLYRDGLVDTAKAVRSYVGLKSRFDAFRTALSSASPMVLPKLGAGTYIVKSFPGNAKNLGSSMSMAVDFARSQRIDVPKDATSAI